MKLSEWICSGAVIRALNSTGSSYYFALFEFVFEANNVSLIKLLANQQEFIAVFTGGRCGACSYWLLKGEVYQGKILGYYLLIYYVFINLGRSGRNMKEWDSTVCLKKIRTATINVM